MLFVEIWYQFNNWSFKKKMDSSYFVLPLFIDNADPSNKPTVLGTHLSKHTMWLAAVFTQADDDVTRHITSNTYRLVLYPIPDTFV